MGLRWRRLDRSDCDIAWWCSSNRSFRARLWRRMGRWRAKQRRILRMHRRGWRQWMTSWWRIEHVDNLRATCAHWWSPCCCQQQVRYQIVRVHKYDCLQTAVNKISRRIFMIGLCAELQNDMQCTVHTQLLFHGSQQSTSCTLVILRFC